MKRTELDAKFSTESALQKAARAGPSHRWEADCRIGTDRVYFVCTECGIRIHVLHDGPAFYYNESARTWYSWSKEMPNCQSITLNKVYES